MCKIMAMSGIKDPKAAWKLVGASIEEMTKGDHDGTGYAAIDSNGKLFGERWVNVADAFTQRKEFSQDDIDTKTRFQGAVKVQETYNRFGEINADDVKAIIFHARYATCGVSLENTHPFVRDDIALIHNGVISNSKNLKNYTSTCDSECILNEYIDHDIVKDPEAIDEFADRLHGYYACAVLANNSGSPIMDVFKDEGASLYVAHVKEIGYVFCTSESILATSIELAELTLLGQICEVNPGYLMRSDAITGKMIDVIEFSYNRRASVTSVNGYFGQPYGHASDDFPKDLDFYLDKDK